MINELYGLSAALNRENIKTQNWYREYNPIPNITKNAPCVCIQICEGKVTGLSFVAPETGKILRKYGNSQGSYPCMNLAPLYKITGDAEKKKLTDLKKHPERIDEACIAEMRAWCTADSNNWGKNFLSKYKLSMEDRPRKLRAAVPQYKPLEILMNETSLFTVASDLHRELERMAWSLLERKEKTALALTVLFLQGKDSEKGKEEYGSISVAFDSSKLIEEGIPAVSESFVLGLNQCLLSEYAEPPEDGETELRDAFNMPFQEINEPMPKVKLAGGFDVTLRTMYKKQLCQVRYGRIEDGSYPICRQMRMDLKGALEWIGGQEQKEKLWTKTDKQEILFAYPSALPKIPASYTAMFQSTDTEGASFVSRAEELIRLLKETKEVGTDSKAKRMTIFILRKLDKACTKVVYTRQTDPVELERCSEGWTLGCANLPAFPFGVPRTLYPLNIADILNCFWKQNGELVTKKYRPYPQYHGIEILMDPELPVSGDLRRLSDSAVRIGPFFGNLSAKNAWNPSMENKAKEMLALMGLFLYRNKIRKDDYMDNLPYLYGQLLKAADELHALYCKVVREDLIPRFMGSAMFQSAAEAPVRTLNLLHQRIIPYYSWLKSYRLTEEKENSKDNKNIRRAKYLYRVFEQIMNSMEQLTKDWTKQTRFSDEEKVQLFIGYLASLPENKQSIKNGEEDFANE